jgi:capsular polysaccharide biosynthesis protein
MVDLSRYGRAAKRSWWLVALMAVLGAVAGGLLLTSSVYESSAVVQVKDGLVDVSVAEATSQAPNMSTEQEVARSASVVAEALPSIPGDLSVTQFLGRASVSSPPDSTTMTLTFTGSSADQAQVGAAEWAEAYLELRTRDLQRALDESTGQLEERLDRLVRQQGDAQAELLNAANGTPQFSQAQSALQSLERQESSTQLKLNSLSAVVLDPGDVIGEPIQPASPSGLSQLAAIVIGALAGMLVGLLLALVLERMRVWVRDERDLHRATRSPVWAVVPPNDPTGRIRAYDAVGARLLLDARRNGLRRILVTGVDTSSEEAANHIAGALGRLGAPVVLTDRVEALLTGRNDGPQRQDEGSESFVVVGGPSLLEDPRTAVMSSEADATLAVVETGITRVRDVERAEERLSASGSAMTGVLLVSRRSRRARRRETRASAELVHQTGSVQVEDAGDERFLTGVHFDDGRAPVPGSRDGWTDGYGDDKVGRHERP